MNWEAVGAIAEGLGAVAVIVTLVYLTFQLRLNTEALRSSAYQALHNAEVELFRDLSQNEALRKLYAKAKSGIESLDDDELDLWSWLSRQHVFLFQNAHFQHAKGAMDDDMWQTWEKGIGESLVAHRGMRQMTRVFSPALSPAFVVCLSKYVAIDPMSSEHAAEKGNTFYPNNAGSRIT